MMPTNPVTIPVTDVVGRQVFSFPPTTQTESYAKIIINRSGTGGTHPWINSLTSVDTLGVEFQFSVDNGQSWVSLGQPVIPLGSEIVKGIRVPVTTEVGVGIGVDFHSGTLFRAILTASTPLTFDGSAVYG